MKKLFFTLLLVVSAVGLSTAQTNYYPNQSGTFNEEGYTMKYVKEYGLFIKLYNSNQRFVFTDIKYKDGRELPFEMVVGDSDVRLYSSASVSKSDLYESIRSFFTSEQLNYLRGEIQFNLYIGLKIDTTTGRVVDVYYDFPYDSKYTSIPPSTYHNIELLIKEHLRFNLTDAASQFTHGYEDWEINFYDYNPM